MATRKRGTKYQADFMLEGARVRETFDTEAEARAFELDCRAAHARGQPLPSPSKGSTKASQASLMEGLLAHCVRVHWASKKSADMLSHNAKLFTDWVGRKAPVSEALTPAKVDEYVLWRQTEKRNSSSTINRHLSAISVMIKYAHRLGLIPATFELPWQKEGYHRMRWFSEDEEAKILRWARVYSTDEEDWEALFVFLIDTGARLSEAERLRWDDIFERRVTFEDTKNGTARSVTMTSRARHCILILRETRPSSKGPFDWVRRTRLRALWSRIQAGEGEWMNDCVVHTFRHTCASRLVQRGVDLYRVKIWMGHKDISTTMRYAKLAPRHLEELATVLESGGGEMVDAAALDAVH